MWETLRRNAHKGRRSCVYMWGGGEKARTVSQPRTLAAPRMHDAVGVDSKGLIEPHADRRYRLLRPNESLDSLRSVEVLAGAVAQLTIDALAKRVDVASVCGEK